ncbi:MAG TPA: cytochrome c biogenesis protein ResB [Candidatus Acidoferrales bacterium]|nr:cytochrome c biogenesis protein ResB [Candidatus Acidoferrales bacterium]
MFIGRLIKIFASLRLTVVLLAFAIVLVFVGTLAQVDEGLYYVQSHYFKALIIFGLNLFGRKIPIILPGGSLIGTLLLVNLLAAHIYRFQFSVKKIGIQFVHAGVILLLVGQLATQIFANESQISFAEGQTRSYSESANQYELAFTSASGPHSEQVVAFPSELLAAGDELHDPNLPFTVRVNQFWKNSDTQFRAPVMQNGPPLTKNGIAVNFDFWPTNEVKTTDDKDAPTAQIELVGPGGSLGDWIVSDWADDDAKIEQIRESYTPALGVDMANKVVAELTAPQFIYVNGKKFTFGLRPEQVQFPFSLTLLKATHTVYEGTDIPKDFRSRVLLKNAQTEENREVEISMNNPLRYAGLTFYQQQMTAGETTEQAGLAPWSLLQVVHNPGWLTPYIACGMVAAGLVIQFMFHLTGFIAGKK